MRALGASMAVVLAQAVTLLMVGLAVALAFLPAIWARAQTGLWYMNTWVQDSSSPEQIWIAAHAITAMSLLGLLFAQVASGMASSSHPRSRAYHRAMGRWVVVPLLVVSLSLAVVAQVLEYMHSGSPHIFINLPVAVIIAAEVFAGVYYATRRAIPQHKDWMTWALIDTASASGLSRGSMYLMQPFFACDPFISDWPIFVGILAATVAASVCLHAGGRLGREHKANTAMLSLHGVLTLATLATSVGFECPADRLIGAERDATQVALASLVGLGAVITVGVIAGVWLRSLRGEHEGPAAPAPKAGREVDSEIRV